MILELLLAHAPDAPALQDLAQEYGADKNRFEKEPSFCVLCGLCVRYCTEVKKKNAIGFFDRGSRREISFIPEIAAEECWNCKECFPHILSPGSLPFNRGAHWSQVDKELFLFIGTNFLENPQDICQRSALSSFEDGSVPG